MAQNEGSCPSDLANYLVKFLSGEGKNGVKIKPGYKTILSDGGDKLYGLKILS